MSKHLASRCKKTQRQRLWNRFPFQNVSRGILPQDVRQVKDKGIGNVVTCSIGERMPDDGFFLEAFLRTQHKRIIKGRPGVLPGLHSDDLVSLMRERILG